VLKKEGGDADVADILERSYCVDQATSDNKVRKSKKVKVTK